MAIPLKYNLRNLVLRWRLTIATVLGVALVVAVFIMVMALARGLRSTYVTTGDPLNLLVLRKGSTSESNSQLNGEQVRSIRYLDGIVRDAQNKPMCSAEIIVLIYLDRRDADGGANVLVRGMGRVGLPLRPMIRLIEGRMFEPGRKECVVSRRIADRFKNCHVGESFRSGRHTWHVVGIFDAAKTAYESEIWIDADEARESFNRDFYGSALLRAADDAAAERLIQRMESDRTLQVRVIREADYYKEQTSGAGPIQFLGTFLSVIMSIGAVFSAMNTMYASVGARTREVGTLRVLGFRRREIYVSFMIEAVVLGGIGGLIGCLLALPLNGLATGTFGWATFAEVAFEFQITGDILAKGLMFSIVMGLVGGMLPARAAARKPVLDALRAA